MVIDHELEVRVHRAVDESDAIRRVGGHSYVVSVPSVIVGICTVDKTIIQCRRTIGFGADEQLVDGLDTTSSQRLNKNWHADPHEGRDTHLMIPIIEKQHSQIFIVISRCRAIDYYTTKDSLPCLQRKVGVVPG